MKIEQIMAKKLSTCRPDQSLNDAARIMWERDCGFVPVVASERDARVVGIVTDRDLCMAAYTRGKGLSEIRIAEVMSKSVRSCRPGDTIAQAEETMRSAQVHRLPVIDDAGQILGVVSLADIAREAAREARSSKQEVTTREIGETLAAIRKARELPGAVA